MQRLVRKKHALWQSRGHLGAHTLALAGSAYDPKRLPRDFVLGGFLLCEAHTGPEALLGFSKVHCTM